MSSSLYRRWSLLVTGEGRVLLHGPAGREGRPPARQGVRHPRTAGLAQRLPQHRRAFCPQKRLSLPASEVYLPIPRHCLVLTSGSLEFWTQGTVSSAFSRRRTDDYVARWLLRILRHSPSSSRAPRADAGTTITGEPIPEGARGRRSGAAAGGDREFGHVAVPHVQGCAPHHIPRSNPQPTENEPPAC